MVVGARACAHGPPQLKPATNVTLTSGGIVVTDFGRFLLLTKELPEMCSNLRRKLAFPCRYFDDTDPALQWLRTHL